jgi:hypothetical protein
MIAGVENLLPALAQFLVALTPLIDPITRIVAQLVPILMPALNPLVNGFSQMATILAGPFGSALANLLTTITPLVGYLGQFLGFVSKIIDKITGAGGVVSGFLGGISHAGSGLLSAVGLAEGTKNFSGGLALVAEAGSPEAIVTPGGLVRVATSPTLVDLEAGTRVLPIGGQHTPLPTLPSLASVTGAVPVTGATTTGQALAAAGAASTKTIHNTVIAQTNANPYQIGQELTWLAKTAD